jgi:hypothetical protein
MVIARKAAICPHALAATRLQLGSDHPPGLEVSI